MTRHPGEGRLGDHYRRGGAFAFRDVPGARRSPACGRSLRIQPLRCSTSQKSPTTSPAARVERAARVASGTESRMNCTWPSAKRKFAPPVWKLYGSLKLVAFRALAFAAGATPSNGMPVAGSAPSKLNGPSLSIHPRPWSFDAAESTVRFRYTSGRAAHSTIMIVPEVPSVTSVILTAELRNITDRLFPALYCVEFTVFCTPIMAS